MLILIHRVELMVKECLRIGYVYVSDALVRVFILVTLKIRIGWRCNVGMNLYSERQNLRVNNCLLEESLKEWHIYLKSG